MIPWTDASVTRSPDLTSALRGLGDELSAHGFTSDSVASLLGAAGDMDLLRNSALYALWSRDRANELAAAPAGVLTEIFVRNGEIVSDVYERLISRTLRCVFDVLEIVQNVDGRVSARASISPLGPAYYLADQLFECRAESDGYPVMVRKAEGDFDPVMPPHASTLLLLQNTAPHGKRLLDVGTGSGVLALHRSDRYAFVAGMDIDPRAVAYARLNALLAGREAAFEVGDFRTGLEEFGPVDHVLFNAPGRASGEVGPSGDAPVLDGSGLVKDVITSLPQALASPDGLAEILVIVPVPQRLPGAEDVVAEWLGGLASPVALKVTELADPALSVPADAIDRLRIQPGCLLADDRAEAESLVRSLKRGGIRNVTPTIVSISS